MGLTDKEQEWADRARRYLKAELKRGEVSYKDLVAKLKDHGLDETEASITGKLNRGTFSVAFFLACLTVLELKGIQLDDI